MKALSRSIGLVAIAASLLGMVVVGTVQANGHTDHNHGSKHITQSQLDLRQDMRKLWEDHITWTRVYIIAALADAPDAPAAADRLLQNQQDIGDLFGQYYGLNRGDQLAELLTVHITTAVDLIEAAKLGDTAAYTEALDAWYANAEDIAVYLHGLNPAWSLVELRTMLNSHLDLTEDEVVARLASNWTADVMAYDQVHDEALMMADMLSIGIIEQFPKQFKKNQ